MGRTFVFSPFSTFLNREFNAAISLGFDIQEPIGKMTDSDADIVRTIEKGPDQRQVSFLLNPIFPLGKK